MKIKYIALCLLLALVGCQRDEEMEIVNATINNELIDPSYSSVSIRCNIKCNATIKNVQAYLSTEADFSSAKSYSLTEKEKNTFGATIEGLKDASTYYVRYEVSNRWSSKMIDEVSEFKTIPYTIPMVQTSEVSEVTHSTAIVGGVITENGGHEITERGVVYSKSPNPSIENGTKVESLEKAESYACTLMDLEYVTTYYVRAYAINEKGVAYGEERSLTTLSTSATMGDISAIEIGGTTATIQAELLTDGGASIEKLGICYNMSGEPTINDSIVLSSENKIGIFQCTIDNLSSATTYYVRAFATNANGTIYSEQISFKTEATIATITTTQAINISYTSATIGGKVMSDGGASVTERGICYSTSANPTTANTKISTGSGLGEFTCNLIDLQDGVTYYARAYAVNSIGTAYGEEVSFTTKAKTIATVVTTPATNVSYTSATVGGDVTDDGGATVTERGICYSTSANPTTANTKITSGSGLGQFTCNLTDLQDGTTYYVRAYATNAKGTAYGEQVTFTTKATTIPTITTAQATNISYTSARVGGHIIDNGGIAVTESGVVYSTSQNPTTLDIKVISERQSDEYTIDLTDLQEGTTYYVRAYAINAKGTAYGEEVSFMTLSLNGHEYVDLGLSVKWATMNVGASKPEDYGDYFAWGETEPKEVYDWSTYKHCQGIEHTLTKYNTERFYGTVDNKTELDAIDDAAVVNWGGAWRMPTDAEMTELREQCTWTWTRWDTPNDVREGYKVTSKSNGNSIFLPAAGYRRDSSLYTLGYGFYWSSSLCTDGPSHAGGVHFNSSSVDGSDESHNIRFVGQLVRPVCP